MDYLIKRSFAVIVLSVMLAGALSACGSKSADDTALTDANE